MPTGDSEPLFDTGLSARLDLRYRLLPRFALVPAVAYARFEGEEGVLDRDLWEVSVAWRWLAPPAGRSSFFVESGPALYLPSRGSSEGGCRLGAGIDLPLQPRWDRLDVELGLEAHRPFDDELIPEFLRAHAGLVVGF